MEWIILAGLLLTVLLVVYGRVREAFRALADNKKLEETIRVQAKLAKKKDEEYLAAADITTTVGFLNRLSSKDPDSKD